MYQLTVETLLGLHLEVDHLRIAPCIPAHWPAYRVRYRYRETIYHLNISNVGEPTAQGRHITLDGVVIEGAAIPLVDDHRDHQVDVALHI
jgi:cellobiose phosphorylase